MKKFKQLPPLDYLRSRLIYNEELGKFFWNPDSSKKNNPYKGREANYQTNKGYIAIRIDGQSYLAHRLAWYFVTGNAPLNQIDHKSGDKLDNRFCNLREATNSQNHANKKKSKANKSGFKGVSFHKQIGMWRARIADTYIGVFHSKEEAALAYEKAANEMFGEFACAA